MSARGANRRLARAGDPAALQRRNVADRARRKGYGDARRLGQLLEATEFARRSNECTVSGERVVIKTAAVHTKRIGLTRGTRERAIAVIAAFALAPGFFEVWYVSMEACEEISALVSGHQLQVTRGAIGRVGRQLGWWSRRERRLIPATVPESCTTYIANVRIDQEEPIAG